MTWSGSTNGSLCIAHSRIGEWTAQSIAAAIHETRAFPSSDFGLLRGIARDSDVLGISVTGSFSSRDAYTSGYGLSVSA